MAKKVKGFIKKHDPAEARGKDAKMPRAHAGHFDPLKPLIKKSEKGVGIRGEHGKSKKVTKAVGAKGKTLAKAHKSLPTKTKKKK